MEDLKPPKEARNPPHNWVEQKEKKKRAEKKKKKGIRMGPALLRGSSQGEEALTPWEATVPEGETQSLREKHSTQTEEVKQEGSSTDH